MNSEGVEYLLVGGYAVAHHGYRRTTRDLDIWIAVDAANAERLSTVLQTFGGFAAAAVPPDLFLQVGKIFMFGREPVRIDILTDPDGVDFRDCFARRQMVAMDGITVPVISLADLRANKAASGRPKDLADLQNLPPDSKPTTRSRRRRNK